MENGICLILQKKEYEIINEIMDLKDDYVGEEMFVQFYECLYNDKTMFVNCDLYCPYFSEEESLVSNRLKIKKIARTFYEKKQFLAEFVPLDKILNEEMLYYSCLCDDVSDKDKFEKMTEDTRSLINEYCKNGKEFVIDNLDCSFKYFRDYDNPVSAKEKYLYEMIRYILDINMKINPLYGDRFVELIHYIINHEYYCIAIDVLNAIEKNKLQSILSDTSTCYFFYERLTSKVEKNASLKEDINVIALLKMFCPNKVIDVK